MFPVAENEPSTANCDGERHAVWDSSLRSPVPAASCPPYCVPLVSEHIRCLAHRRLNTRVQTLSHALQSPKVSVNASSTLDDGPQLTPKRPQSSQAAVKEARTEFNSTHVRTSILTVRHIGQRLLRSEETKERATNTHTSKEQGARSKKARKHDNKRATKRTNERTNERTNKRTNAQINKRTHERTNEQTNERTNK